MGEIRDDEKLAKLVSQFIEEIGKSETCGFTLNRIRDMVALKITNDTSLPYTYSFVHLKSYKFNEIITTVLNHMISNGRVVLSSVDIVHGEFLESPKCVVRLKLNDEIKPSTSLDSVEHTAC
jgi:hypothetical protein